MARVGLGLADSSTAAPSPLRDERGPQSRGGEREPALAHIERYVDLMLRTKRESPAPDPVAASIADIPECNPGATAPVVFATEQAVAVAYRVSSRWLAAHHGDWAGGVAGVRFHGVRSHSFGAPNDEAFHGHPLARYGLKPYEFVRVDNSPWIESLRVMNSVHPHHRDEAFLKLQHFVLPFHNTTFECVARGYTVETSDAAETTQAAMVRRLIGE